MTLCGAIQEGHGPHTHSCIGDRGHPGRRHWCLLGHTWADDDEEEES